MTINDISAPSAEPTSTDTGRDLEPQPLLASVKRAVRTLDDLGFPLTADDTAVLDGILANPGPDSIQQVDALLDSYTLAHVVLDAHGFGKTTPGGAERILTEYGWRAFLVRVENRHHLRDQLHFSAGKGGLSLNFTPSQMSVPMTFAQSAWIFDSDSRAPLVKNMWLTGELRDTSPLSGFDVEYRVLQLFSRDRGENRTYFGLTCVNNASAMTDGRQGVWLDFECEPSFEIPLRIKDADGRGCVASLTIKDREGRVYPPQAMRIAPDMRFHPHIYRGDGETVLLPAGEYTVGAWRGPEYLRTHHEVTITGENDVIDVALQRWVEPRDHGWYAGESHIHAAGCSHYEIPTEGVNPETIIRQVRGEALTVGNVLTWGPGYYHQKQFFSGEAISPDATLEHADLQEANNARWQIARTEKDHESLLRYDLEVSGFPSSHCGHLVLLGLKDQDYPGTKVIEDWPSWNLPILKWAKAQGAVLGFAHCSIGMAVDDTNLPNYDIPEFYGVGTNEAIIDVTHGVVDFLSGAHSFPTWELNAWYHMLNSGYRLGFVGETDYPCISDERPGFGRSYVRLDESPVGEAGYRQWIDGIRDGRFYFCDGRSHFLDFTVNGTRNGEDDVVMDAAETVTVDATVSVWLDEQPDPTIAGTPAFTSPAWHPERARVEGTREVPVELVVNGYPVAEQRITADGSPQQVSFEVPIEHSSWVSLRVMPTGHTFPVFVTVAGKPVRASRRSAQWCRDSVEKMWQVHEPFMREAEKADAREAFDHARDAYEQRMKESVAE